MTTYCLQFLVLCLCTVQLINGHHHHDHHDSDDDDEPTPKKSNEPIVHTRLGKIRGSTDLKTRLGKTILSFRGIRYGKPPVGEQRFKAPEAVESWGDMVLNATDDGPACHQPVVVDFAVNEDCLNLNVYTRQLPSRKHRLRPVMMFFYPGGFYGWTGASYFVGPQYLMDEDIVLVTFNYRLGTLGFLSTGDEYAPGNYGMKDQVLAMKWVKKHIKNFGGDPNQITLFGYSAGGYSISMHLASPMTKGLFHRAVSMSGTGVKLTPTPTNQTHLAIKQAELLNCPSSTSKEIVDCLRTKGAQEIASTFFSFQELGIDPTLIWEPVIEPEIDGSERYLVEDLAVSLLKGNYKKVPFMAGTTTLEFAPYAYRIVRNETLLNIWNTNFTYAAPIGFQYERNTERSKNISLTLRSFYLNDQPIDNSTVDQLGKIYEDSIVGFPLDQLVHLVQQKNTKPVYYYKFAYQGRFSFYYEPGTNNTIGPVHHDDLSYLLWLKFFRFPLLGSNDPEIMMVERMIKLWTNFAKYGNPTPKRDQNTGNVIWTPYTTAQENYMEINETMSMQSHYNRERYELFRTLFPLPKV